MWGCLSTLYQRHLPKTDPQPSPMIVWFNAFDITANYQFNSDRINPPLYSLIFSIANGLISLKIYKILIIHLIFASPFYLSPNPPSVPSGGSTKLPIIADNTHFSENSAAFIWK